MANIDDSNLNIRAAVIRDETGEGLNTATRVGTMLGDFADSKINNDKINTDVTLAANSDSLLASQKAVKAYVDSKSGPAKVYNAIISQSGSGDPAVTLINSSFTGAITFARTGTGLFTITSANSEFTSGKTMIFFGNGTTGGQNPVGGRLSDSVIGFVGRISAGTAADSQIDTCSVKIEVYS